MFLVLRNNDGSRINGAILFLSAEKLTENCLYTVLEVDIIIHWEAMPH